MKMEIVEIPANRTRLTIAKDRATLKFSKDTSLEMRTRQMAIAEKAISILQTSNMLTRRGSFGVNSNDEVGICLYIGKDKDPQWVTETKN